VLAVAIVVVIIYLTSTFFNTPKWVETNTNTSWITVAKLLCGLKKIYPSKMINFLGIWYS